MRLQDVLNTEGEAETLEEFALSMQRFINSGMVWSFPGRNGRAAMDALESGLCMLPDEPRKDYYGNRVPARSDLVPGSVGTRELVVASHGEEWALMLEGAEG